MKLVSNHLSLSLLGGLLISCSAQGMDYLQAARAKVVQGAKALTSYLQAGSSEQQFVQSRFMHHAKAAVPGLSTVLKGATYITAVDQECADTPTRKTAWWQKVPWAALVVARLFTLEQAGDALHSTVFKPMRSLINGAYGFVRACTPTFTHSALRVPHFLTLDIMDGLVGMASGVAVGMSYFIARDIARRVLGYKQEPEQPASLPAAPKEVPQQLHYQ
jgi:hypothetical protein